MDLVLGFFIIYLVPANDVKAMGTRYTPDTGQLNNGLKNIMNFFLKRSQTLWKIKSFLSSTAITYLKETSMQECPIEMVQEDRKRH